MFREILDTTWKRVALYIIVATLIIGALFTVIYAKFEERNTIEESETTFKQVENEVTYNEKVFELMYEYVKKQVPYKTTIMNQAEVDMVIRDTIRDVWLHDNDGMIEESQFIYLAWQMQQAILNQDIDEFIGTFQTNAYLQYLHQFESVDEIDTALNELMRKISRDGTFEYLTYNREKYSNNKVKITLYYANRDKLTLNMSTSFVADNHLDIGGNGKYELFSTKFEELIEQL